MLGEEYFSTRYKEQQHSMWQQLCVTAIKHLLHVYPFLSYECNQLPIAECKRHGHFLFSSKEFLKRWISLLGHILLGLVQQVSRLLY